MIPSFIFIFQFKLTMYKRVTHYTQPRFKTILDETYFFYNLTNILMIKSHLKNSITSLNENYKLTSFFFTLPRYHPKNHQCESGRIWVPFFMLSAYINLVKPKQIE